METKWMEWKNFGNMDLSNIAETGGVYQFRCIGKDGFPITVSRLKDKDRDGIIYIGSSKNLRTRINGFWTTIERKDYSRHAAVWTYYGFNYYRLFPPKQLQFRYKVVKEPTDFEFNLLLSYRKKFMDLPPLNSSRGIYPENWENKMEKVFGRRPSP